MTAFPLRKSNSKLSLAALVERVTEVLQLGNASDLNHVISSMDDAQRELDNLIPVLELLDELGKAAFSGEPGHCSVTDCGHDLSLAQLDDFQIVGELSRGGMGVVYEAVQISLGRRVALKVLPVVPILDHRHAARFEKEAQITATLEHPNIVPVYAMGNLRHLQYYAMRLVPGQNLAELIASLPNQADNSTSESAVPAGPSRNATGCAADGSDDSHRVAQGKAPEPPLTERLAASKTQRYYESAKLGIQAAEALQYAHDRGVIHRDIKPSNFLVGDDGHLWLTDFGLARLSDANDLTTTGDMIGTVRYMSPEQARGNSSEIDSRTDIYSLGVTLYELLALQPAFRNIRPYARSPDISSQEPCPLRKIDSSIPRDLEIVVSKAMAEDVEDRYDSASELAADLRRFVNHRAILAKPPTVWDHACKLVRRNAKLSCLLCIAALLSVAILSAGMRMIHSERSAAAALADRERQAAAAAIWQEQNAERARERAEKNLLYAHAAVDRMFESADSGLSAVPNSDRLRHDLLEDALIFYQALLQEAPEDDELKCDLDVAFDRVSALNHRIGSGDDADAANREPFEFFQHLARKSSGTPLYQMALAEVVRERSEICLATTGRRDHAAKFVRLRIRLLSDLTRQFPDRMEYQLKLALTFSTLGQLLGDMGHHGEALESLNQAMMIWADVIPKGVASNHLVELASTRLRLGSVCLSMNRLEEAEHHLMAAQSRLIGDQRPTSQLVLAKVQKYRARLLVHQGDFRHALARLMCAIELCSDVTSASPDTVECRQVTAGCHWDLFQLYSAIGNPVAAEQALDVSTRHLSRIAGPGKGGLDQQLGLARNQLSHGRLLLDAQLFAQANQRFESAAALLEASVVQFSDSGDPHSALSWLLATCPDGSFRDELRAVQLAERAVALEPNRGWHWQALGAACYRAGAWSECVEACEQSQRLGGVDRALILIYSAMAHQQLAEIDTARQSYQQALNCREQTSWNGTELVPLQREAALLIYGNSAK